MCATFIAQLCTNSCCYPLLRLQHKISATDTRTIHCAYNLISQPKLVDVTIRSFVPRRQFERVVTPKALQYC